MSNTINKQLYSIIIFLSICFLGISGCERKQPKTDFLIRIGSNIVTDIDFEQLFEIAKTGYPQSASMNNELKKEIRLQVLDQLIEKMVIQERAKELNIEITDAELEKAISKVKEDYPEGEFEKTLLESSISYTSWKKEFKDRLLMEKVVEKDITDKIKIKPEDVAEYYQKEFKKQDGATGLNPSKDIYETILTNLRRKKTEEAYEQWMKELKSKYPIEINTEKWNKMSELNKDKE